MCLLIVVLSLMSKNEKCGEKNWSGKKALKSGYKWRQKLCAPKAKKYKLLRNRTREKYKKTRAFFLKPQCNFLVYVHISTYKVLVVNVNSLLGNETIANHVCVEDSTRKKLSLVSLDSEISRNLLLFLLVRCDARS